MIIRPMQHADVPGVMIVEHASFTIPWSEQAFYHEIQNNPFAVYYIAEKDGQVIGYAGMWVIIDEAHITNIAVYPTYRGQKIGKRLMDALIEHANRMAVARMTLEVRASNFVAQKMYSDYGFTYQSTRAGYYTDNFEDAWVLTKEWERT